MHYIKSYDIAGYTHSDGYCLCVNHGTDDKGSELPDPGNETGKVFPIFEGSETDTGLICDVCYTELFASGGDVREAIILAANIDVDEDEEDSDDGSEEEGDIVPLSVIKEFVESQRNIDFWTDVDPHGITNYRFTDTTAESRALQVTALGGGLYSVTVDPSIQHLWDEKELFMGKL